jgi:uncharacterized membrane protein YidH (DUF202 family)
VSPTTPSVDRGAGQDSGGPPHASEVGNTEMAAERTWLAWWRTGLAASAGALAVGRFAPNLLQVAPWPYVVLGCGYAASAIGLLVIGASRQRKLHRTIVTGKPAPVSFAVVAGFTVAGVLLALMTAVLVLAQL